MSGLLRVIPLGGLGEIGINMMAIEYDDRILVVDAGLMFPKEEMLGVDLVIPDITYLVERADRVEAIILTHGHEDHIGALPFVIDRLRVPMYGTRMTLGLVRQKLKDRKRLTDAVMHEVKAGDVVNLPPFSVEFIHVAHSIPGTTALAITTPAGIVMHSGDFKLDQTPVDGHPTDIGKLGEYGRKGVLLFMSDSTNAEQEGHTPSEQLVGDAFRGIFPHAEGRIIITTFASNIYRLQQALEVASQFGRKVAVVGRSMTNNIHLAQELGLIKVPENTLVSVKQLKNLPAREVVVLSTGAQGEPLSALSRIANREHPQVQVEKGDTIILSATPIPGNEELVHRTINNLYRHGAKVFYSARNRVHVSGHASADDLKIVLNLVRPKFFVPIHGEDRHLAHHGLLAEDVGLATDNVMVARDGDVLEVGAERFVRTGKIDAGYVFVDGLGIGDVGSAVLRDRRHLAEDGVFVVVLSIDHASGAVIGRPDVVTRGFVHLGTSEALIEAAKDEVMRAMVAGQADVHEPALLQERIRDVLSRYLYEQTKRRPMVVPVVMQV
ncbi:MAG: ribonuclease [Chloroflexota bacterium]|nr:ribonuclease [Chloroflexota bacterium]